MTICGSVAKPPAVTKLDHDKHGRPIPWFVHRDGDGVPDFRVIRAGGLADALRLAKCWICGRTRGRHAAFVIGPMCAINRTSAEPPSHLECAVYAARTCPFLTVPNMQRRESGMPPGSVDPAGVMLRRNPGVVLVWSSKTWSLFQDGEGGVLFDVGDPTATRWFAHGERTTTLAEVLESIDSGLPELIALTEGQPDARADLERRYGELTQLVSIEHGALR